MGTRETAFQDAWRDVRVIDASAALLTGVDGAIVGCRITAVVHLGTLAPADVEVQAVGPSSGRESETGMKRLWPTQSYSNGAFRFETDLQSDALDCVDEHTLLVAPSCHWSATESAAVERPVARVVVREQRRAVDLEPAREMPVIAPTSPPARDARPAR